MESYFFGAFVKNGSLGMALHLGSEPSRLKPHQVLNWALGHGNIPCGVRVKKRAMR